MPTIKNIKDLNNVIQPYIIKALEKTRDEIFEVVSQKVFDYYEEPVFNKPDETKPDYYQRTYNLMESLSASHINKNGDYYEFTVGWDRDYLSFRYPKGFGSSKYNGITGLQVLKAFNDGSHGYTVLGSHDFWNEAIEELGGEKGIISRFKNNLKNCGLPLK